MERTYKPRAIETIAQNTLALYNQELVNGEPCEIPIDEIIEFHFGIILQYRNLTKNGAILGMTVFENSVIPIYDNREKRYEPIVVKGGTILIDNRLLAKNMAKRLRFTMAHELGHYIIHQEYYTEIDELASKLSTDSDFKTEREADELGAALLMPYGRLKVAYKRLNGRLSRDDIVPHLSSLFNVSNQSMKIRLQKLHLI